jgi:two-component system cell cycle sensor histidine kinase/response regulator CckA
MILLEEAAQAGKAAHESSRGHLTVSRLRRAWRLPAFLQRSLRARLIVLFATLLGLIALFVFWRLPIELEQHAMRGVESKAVSVATMAAYSVAPALVFGDTAAAYEVTRSVSGIEHVAYVLIRGDRGQLLAALNPAVAARFDGRGPGVTRDKRIYLASAPIRSADGTIGTVQVGFWLAGLHEQVASIRLRLALYSIGILLIGLIGVYLIAGSVIAPVQRLVRTMGILAGGDLAERVRSTRADELGHLARSFDSMVDQLGERTSDLGREMDERVRAQAAQRSSEQHFRAIFDSAGVGIALLDQHGAILESNPAMRAMLGHGNRSSESVLHLRVHDQDWPLVRREFARLMTAEANSVQVQARIAKADSSHIWVHGVGTIVSDEISGETGIIAMIQDISEQKELEERLRQSQKLEGIGQLAGGVAHDFNNLLTTINGTCELMLHDVPADSPLRADIESVRFAGDRAAALTRQLLAFSRKQVLQSTVLDVNTVITDTTRLLERLITENIVFSVCYGAGLPNIKVDRGQLEQVLINLVVNARDAMPQGGRVSIETNQIELTEAAAARYGMQHAGSYVVITVADSGEGMDIATMARIFEPFYTTKEVGKGTGLGLATVYGIVKQSGGGVHVQSEPGRGATFRVALPACAHVRSESVEASTTRDERRGHETVLLIEDQQQVRNLLLRVLRRSGYHVLHAMDGRDGIKVAESYEGVIDLVISDVVMPGMSGPEAVDLLKVHRPDIEVLHISGYTESEVVHHGVSTEAMNFLQKPLAPAALTHKVRQILDEAAMRGEPRVPVRAS